MKELVINNGGRRLFNEDLNSLQDHLKAVQEIFKGESPFILSGIQYSLVSGTTYNISEGYVWLGNKIRYFSGANSVNVSTEQYINTADSTTSRLYEDNNRRLSLLLYRHLALPILLNNKKKRKKKQKISYWNEAKDRYYSTIKRKRKQSKRFSQKTGITLQPKIVSPL